MGGVMAYCDGCFYQKHFTGAGPYCDYLCMVGKRRPCPPGDGCTARKTTKRVSKYGIEFGKGDRTDLSGMTPEEKAAYITERKRQYERERYAKRCANKTPEEKERERIAHQKYYQRTKAERNAKHKAYYEAHKEELNAKRRERNRKKKEMKENG